MNKTTLLIVGLVAGIAVIGYSALSGNEESAKSQPSIEAAPIELVSSPDKEIGVNKQVNSQDDNTAAISNDDTYVRSAPPPPLSARHSRDNRNNTPQAHGHEEVSDNQKKNAPPPPTGANY
jgi:hypothetical protein